jgi:general secretion pathway protein I
MKLLNSQFSALWSPLPVIRERDRVRAFNKGAVGNSAISCRPSPQPSPGLPGEGEMRRRGFTLIEVLAAVMLMALVLPAVMRGISMADKAADDARHRTEAAGLAQTELAEIVATQSWQTGDQTGDFSPDWPAYSWKSAVAPWVGDTSGAGIQQIDLTVTWTSRGQVQSLNLTTLAYPRAAQTSTNG